ncbi:MAG TPA: DUF4258 domain-containing protein [Phycisphaerae bacterium]|nr:DUF4258 domain-containing protein [Phycisphaerae bacterium]
MPTIFDTIQEAVREERFLVSWHADERCEERAITAWQIAVGLESARLMQARPHSQPNPTVIVRQLLADGSEVEVVWAWLEASRRAVLVTVYWVN